MSRSAENGWGTYTALALGTGSVGCVSCILPQGESSSCVLNAQQKLKLLPFRILSSTSSLVPVRRFPTVSGVPTPLFSQFMTWRWVWLLCSEVKVRVLLIV